MQKFVQIILAGNFNLIFIYRYETTKQRFAMLDTLLSAEKEGLITQQGIQEEVDTFMFEGHDTTGVSLTMTLLLLAHHPEVQEKILEDVLELQKEIEAEKFNVSDYNKLKFLDRVIKESLRLYPSVAFISRTLSEDLALGLINLQTYILNYKNRFLISRWSHISKKVYGFHPHL